MTVVELFILVGSHSCSYQRQSGEESRQEVVTCEDEEVNERAPEESQLSAVKGAYYAGGEPTSEDQAPVVQ